MKKAKITKSFRRDGKRFFPGDVAQGDDAAFAVEGGFGSLAPVAKKAAPRNKARKPSKNKG